MMTDLETFSPYSPAEQAAIALLSRLASSFAAETKKTNCPVTQQILQGSQAAAERAAKTVRRSWTDADIVRSRRDLFLLGRTWKEAAERNASLSPLADKARADLNAATRSILALGPSSRR